MKANQSDHLSSAEYQKAKKLKSFNKDEWKWNPATELYDKIQPGYLHGVKITECKSVPEMVSNLLEGIDPDFFKNK